MTPPKKPPKPYNIGQLDSISDQQQKSFLTSSELHHNISLATLGRFAFYLGKRWAAPICPGPYMGKMLVPDKSLDARYHPSYLQGQRSGNGRVHPQKVLYP